MLSLQSYRAVLDVNRKDPSPFQFDAATLHTLCFNSDKIQPSADYEW